MSTYLIYEEPAIVAIEHLKKDSIDCIFTSPNPPRSDSEIASLVEFFKKAQDYIKDTGVVFVQLGDYHDKMGNLGNVPGLFIAFMKHEGWTYRSAIYWHRLHDQSKMEDEMRFRRDVETIMMFAPDKNHYFNDRLGMHKTSLISTSFEKVRKTEFKSGFPREVVRRCILPATKPADIILDPYCGTGTTGVVALTEGRHFIGFEIRKGWKEKIDNRLKNFGWKEIEDDQPNTVISTAALEIEQQH